jgi:hypothetical protein
MTINNNKKSTTVVSLVLLLLLLLLLLPPPPQTFCQPMSSISDIIITVQQQQIEQEANWIMNCVIEPSGAIATYTLQPQGSATYYVSPYIANYASMGLSRASAYTQNDTYVQASWKWLQWYQDHQEANTGYVTDYRSNSSSDPTDLISTGNMDSTDAYAGTFLLACLEAYKASQNLSALQYLHQGIRMALTAIESTQDTDGLTWAKPTYHVKYLMDISEVYGGLLATMIMAQLLNDDELYARAQNDSQRLYQGAQNLWNPTMQAFNWAVFSDGVQQVNNWTVFYPDAASQMWAAAFALTTESQANEMITIFLNDHPQWIYPMDQDIFNTNGQFQLETIGYFPLIAFALLRYNRSELAFQSVSSIEQGAVNVSKAWPFTPYSQAMILMVQTDDLIGSYYEPPVQSSKPSTSGAFSDTPSDATSPHLLAVCIGNQQLLTCYLLCLSLLFLFTLII